MAGVIFDTILGQMRQYDGGVTSTGSITYFIGGWDASGGTYPATGGTGAAGAIAKGNLWYITVAGTLPTGQVVEIGDTILALIDNPGQTQGNWLINQTNIGYVPLNAAGGTMTGRISGAKSTNIASNTTTDLNTATGNYVHITGTTTIASFGTVTAGTQISVVFDGILVLTYNATSLILPTAASITTQANDCAIFESEGSGNWKCISYLRADGTALVSAAGIYGIANSSGIYTYYTTLTLAMAAASSGQTIEMFADITESGAVTIQWKDGVKLDGHNHTYTYTNNSIPFDDSNTAPTAWISNWLLNVTVYTGYAFDSQGATYGENFRIRSTLGAGYNADTGGKVFNINSVTKFVALNLTDTTNFAYFCYAESTYTVYDAVTASIKNAGSVYNSVGVRTNGSGFQAWAAGGTGSYYNCSFLVTVSSGQGCVSSSYYNCTSVSTDRAFSQAKCYNCTAKVTGSAGSAFVSCSIVENSTGISDLGICADDCAYISNSTLTTTSGGATITRGTTIINNTIINNYNNANGHGILIDKATAIIGNSIQVTSASANCISAASALNASYTNNRFTVATTPVNANVTQTNANLADLQLNIKY